MTKIGKQEEFNDCEIVSCERSCVIIIVNIKSKWLVLDENSVLVSIIVVLICYDLRGPSGESPSKIGGFYESFTRGYNVS